MIMHTGHPTPDSPAAAPESAARRELLQQIGLLLGAAALPASAVFGASNGSGRRFLDAQAFRLLTAVADTLVPRTDTDGAVRAGIPQQIDSLLRDWASAATRAQLTGALARIDAAATATGARGFAQLKPAARQSLLRLHDTAALQAAPRGNGPLSVAEIMAGPPVMDAAYARLKELVVALYYSSKIGLTQELTYVHAPGKWQPSVPVTKDTRPAGGGGPF
jgi:gluconate 2-dehydrogenase gamma chain